MKIPAGWKLVPEYPTQEMCEAAKYGVDARLSVFKWCDGYKAMLASAPECADLAAAQQEIARLRAALDEIGGLSRHLRNGGPDESDLEELSDGLENAVHIAVGALEQTK